LSLFKEIGKDGNDEDEEDKDEDEAGGAARGGGVVKLLAGIISGEPGRESVMDALKRLRTRASAANLRGRLFGSLEDLKGSLGGVKNFSAPRGLGGESEVSSTTAAVYSENGDRSVDIAALSGAVGRMSGLASLQTSLDHFADFLALWKQLGVEGPDKPSHVVLVHGGGVGNQQQHQRGRLLRIDGMDDVTERMAASVALLRECKAERVGHRTEMLRRLQTGWRTLELPESILVQVLAECPGDAVSPASMNVLNDRAVKTEGWVALLAAQAQIKELKAEERTAKWTIKDRAEKKTALVDVRARTEAIKAVLRALQEAVGLPPKKKVRAAGLVEWGPTLLGGEKRLRSIIELIPSPLDQDGDRELDAVQLRAALATTGLELTESQVLEVLADMGAGDTVRVSDFKTATSVAALVVAAHAALGDDLDASVPIDDLRRVMYELGHKITERQYEQLVMAVGDDDGLLGLDELKLAVMLVQILLSDLEGDGFIGRDEAKDAFERFGGEELSDSYVDALFKAGDADGDNKLSLLEFRAAVDMSRFMSGVDADGNGYVDAAELEDFLSQQLPEPATEAQVATVMGKAEDVAGEGRISFVTFRAMQDDWHTWLSLGSKSE